MSYFKQKSDKNRISLFISAGFFALILIMSFSSINDAYGEDSEILIENDIDNSLNDDLNQIESIQNTSSNGNNNSENSENSSNINPNGTTKTGGSSTAISNGNAICDRGISFSPNFSSKSDSYLINHDNSFLDGMINSDFAVSTSSSSSFSSISSISSHYNENYFENSCKYDKSSYLIANDNSEKERKSTYQKHNNTDDISFDSSYFTFQSYYPNSDDYQEYFNDIIDYVNNNYFISSMSSEFKGNGFENLNHFINILSALDFNKLDNNDEDISFIQDFQSSFKSSSTILFFIRLFMEHHDNGKEHLNSF